MDKLLEWFGRTVCKPNGSNSSEDARCDSVGMDLDTETSSPLQQRHHRAVPPRKVISVTGFGFHLCFRANGNAHNYFSLDQFGPFFVSGSISVESHLGY